jgi:hypothetical protein
VLIVIDVSEEPSYRCHVPIITSLRFVPNTVVGVKNSQKVKNVHLHYSIILKYELPGRGEDLEDATMASF